MESMHTQMADDLSRIEDENDRLKKCIKSLEGHLRATQDGCLREINKASGWKEKARTLRAELKLALAVVEAARHLYMGAGNETSQWSLLGAAFKAYEATTQTGGEQL